MQVLLMRNPKRKNAMENNIELFDRYIDGSLGVDEKQDFDERIASDKAFRIDFRLYLFTLRGVCQEAEQENIEFGHAMKNISEAELMRIIGRNRQPRMLRLSYLRERLAWVASIAAVLIVGIFTVLNVRQTGMDRLDNTIVAYNYIPESNRGESVIRGWEDITSNDIPTLEQAYKSAPADDIQAQEDAGMRLAMAYLKVHDRKKAKDILTELSARFADDEEFSAQCNRILNQLK